MNRCRNCGATEGLIAISDGYDWDSNNELASCVPQTIHICEMAGECADRVIEQGSNIEALGAIARDTENYFAEQVAAARERIHEMSELAQAVARGDDAAAREQGYGAIGHG